MMGLRIWNSILSARNKCAITQKDRYLRAGAGDNILLSLSTFREVAMIPYSDNWLSCMERSCILGLMGATGNKSGTFGITD